MITVHRMVPKHSRCRRSFHVQEFYLTTEKQLFLKGYCYRCKQDVTLLIPLQEMVDNCPSLQDGFTIKDISDLHQMGVSLPS